MSSNPMNQYQNNMSNISNISSINNNNYNHMQNIPQSCTQVPSYDCNNNTQSFNSFNPQNNNSSSVCFYPLILYYNTRFLYILIKHKYRYVI